MSLDVILWLLSDIQRIWGSSWSVESHFCPLPVDNFAVFNVWGLHHGWKHPDAHCIPLSLKPELNASFSSELFNPFGIMNRNVCIPIIFKALLRLFYQANCKSYCMSIVVTPAVFFLFCFFFNELCLCWNFTEDMTTIHRDADLRKKEVVSLNLIACSYHIDFVDGNKFLCYSKGQ